jgi:hypothetical protein
MKKAPPGALPKGVADLPSKVKLSAKGNLCEATLSMKTDDAVGLIKTMMFPPLPEKKP